MNGATDPDLVAFRQGYYDLLVSLLAREPSPAILTALGAGLDARAASARQLDTELGEGWDALARFVGRTPAPALAETVADEYTRLFVGPHGAVLQPYESFYLSGRLLDRPLAALRATLASLGVARRDEVVEPEDFIAVELDVMRALLRREAGATGSDAAEGAREAQVVFLSGHLLVWGPAIARDLAAAGGAGFYGGVGRILGGFLRLEQGVLAEWGREAPSSLETTRARFRGPEWTGPLMDFPGGKTPGKH